MVKRLKNYIGGQFVEAEAKEYLPVTNPATCEVLAEVPDSSYADVDRAVQAAKEGFEEWRSTPVLSRAQYMYRLKNVLEDKFEELARIVVMENGKTMDEARGEVRRGIESVDFATSVPSILRAARLQGRRHQQRHRRDGRAPTDGRVRRDYAV
jgi:malonate-semialdehyde dehydrogenase (acetylating) / methylmalonate-semialdehyde dehydrogenase